MINNAPHIIIHVPQSHTSVTASVAASQSSTTTALLVFSILGKLFVVFSLTMRLMGVGGHSTRLSLRLAFAVTFNCLLLWGHQNFEV